MKLSVVIPCLNEAETIGTQLGALTLQEWSEPWEILICDNGSTDGTLAIVERYRERLPNVRVVDASDRRGAAHATNVGVRAALSESLAFCDADDEMEPGWVAAMGEALRKHDFVAGRFEMKKLNPPWLHARHPQESGLNVYRYPPYLLHAGTGNMGVRRNIHESVGGFDETMLALQDTDYCFRIQLSGTSLHFVPDAVMHIRTMRTFRITYRKAVANGEYNVLLYKKYRPLGMPELSWRTSLFSWMYLMLLLPQARTKGGFAGLVWNLGVRLGRVRGCVKHRVMAM